MGQQRGKPGAEVAARLSPLSGDLDRLQADLSEGVRDARHFDELEERGQSIALGIRSAFRVGRIKR